MKVQTLVRRIPLPRTLIRFSEQHVRSIFDRFSARIAAVHVELRDKNGRRGGGDKQCRIRVQLATGAGIVVQEEQASIRTAVRRAAGRAATELRHLLRRD
ncbi:MAG TPA: HPF/RaiA family ribosome-associated protein [Phycisphaerae bacterium]|nr:HPF/RaiA family ribosome-associated protein [Phycisphaerae bacterium]